MHNINVSRQTCCVCGESGHKMVATAPDMEYPTSEQEYSFVRCVKCEHLYLCDVPNPEEFGRIYPDNYMNYSDKRDQSFAFRVKRWLDKKSIHTVMKRRKIPQHILDVGCADGMLLDVMKDIYPDAHSEGLEIAPKVAAVAQHKGYQVHVGNVELLEVAAEKYDIIFMQQVIEHVHHPRAVLQKLREGLSDEGLIWIETPTSHCVDAKWFKKKYWGGYHFPRHFNIFSAEGLSHIAEQEGLSVEKVFYKPQPVHWIWSCHHCLRDKHYPAWLYERFHLKNPVLLGIFTAVEMVMKLTTGRSSNMVMLLKKDAKRGK